MEFCPNPLEWTSPADAGLCGRRLWLTLMGCVSRAMLHPGIATTNDYVVSVMFVGAVFYLFLFVAGVARPQS